MIPEIVPTQRKSNNAVTSLIIQGNRGYRRYAAKPTVIVRITSVRLKSL